MKNKICVLGGGSWGTTIASHLAKNGHTVSLWEFMEAQVQEMKIKRKLSFLPQLQIPKSLIITSKMEEALKDAEIIFSIVPSQFVRSTWKNAKQYLPEKTQAVVSLSKGIENNSLLTMTEIIREECPLLQNKIVVVSGPSHAEEVALEIPTAIIAASKQKQLAEKIQQLLSTPYLRIYTHPDILGAELCGSLKNIFAIACGGCDGLGLGDNTKAALVTRGLNEMAKLGAKMGAQQITFFGLAGMGDLIVTCFSKHSRNRLLGEKIGQGKTAESALKEMTMVAEGYPTSKSAFQLLQKYNCDCPIITEIYKVLYESKNIKDSLHDLLNRPVHNEIENTQWSN